MNSQRKILLELLETFHENGLLKHLILIGSWADFLYEECSVIENYTSLIRTQDIDWLILNRDRPSPPVSLHKILTEKEYMPNFSRSGIVCYGKDEFEVEFLSMHQGRPTLIADCPGVGITAEVLTHVDMLARFRITVDYKGYPVQIPEPAALALHKMIIRKERKPDKQEKDLNTIIGLLIRLTENDAGTQSLKAVYADLFIKEKKQVELFLYEHYPLLVLQN